MPITWRLALANTSRYFRIAKNIKDVLENDAALISFWDEDQHGRGGKRYFWVDDVVFPANNPSREDTPYLAMYNDPSFPVRIARANQLWEYEFTQIIELAVYGPDSSDSLLVRYYELVMDALTKAGKNDFQQDGDPNGGNNIIREWNFLDGQKLTPEDTSGRGRSLQMLVFGIDIRFWLLTE